MIKAVFFDWFNTLAWFNPPREKIYANACREFGIEVAEDKLSGGLLMADHFYANENLHTPLGNRPLSDQKEVYAQYQRIVLREAGIEISDKMAILISQMLGGASAKLSFTLFNDVLPTLKLLKQRDLILGLISNIDRDMMPICRDLNIEPYLSIVVTSKEAGSEKPHPPIFLAALERAGVEASEALYTGDQYSLDIVGARGVGIKAVLIDRYDLFQEITDCPRIRTLAEIEGQL